MTNNFKNLVRENKIFLSIFAIAFLIRFYFLSISISMQGMDGVVNATTDSVNYLKMAHWILGADISYPEGRFFDWGIGPASWLAGILYIFNSNFVILLLQIIMSSLSCGLIYKLVLELLHKKSIAVVTSLLLTFSITSINLSILILSDSLYFFLMILSLYLFVIGIKRDKWKYFIFASLFSGYAILVRSIGMLWPFALCIIFLLLLKLSNRELSWSQTFKQTKSILIKFAVSLVLIFTIMSSWMFVNYSRYDAFTLAFSSARGPANIVSFTEERLTGKPFKEIPIAWVENYKIENNITNISYKQLYALYQNKSKEYIFTHKWETFKTYIMICWENTTNINMLHRGSLPNFKNHTYQFEQFFLNYYLNYLNIILTLTGLIILFFRKEYLLFSFFTVIYGYYFLMVGAIRWQGSRLFYPSQLAAVILMAVSLVYIYNKLYYLIELMSNRLKSK